MGGLGMEVVKAVPVHTFFNKAAILNQEFDVVTCEAEEGERIPFNIYMQMYNFMVSSLTTQETCSVAKCEQWQLSP